MWAFLKVFVEFTKMVTIWLLLFRFWFFGFEACGILAAWPGIKLTPPALEDEILTAGLPGKSLNFILDLSNFILLWLYLYLTMDSFCLNTALRGNESTFASKIFNMKCYLNFIKNRSIGVVFKQE